MTVTIEQLGRRAVKCKAWPGIIEGMKELDHGRVLWTDGKSYANEQIDDHDGVRECDHKQFPIAAFRGLDLSDRATLALLRDIVARAYGGTQCTVDYQVPYAPGAIGYLRITNDAANTLYQDLLKLVTDYPVVEALVCALEAAPEHAP